MLESVIVKNYTNFEIVNSQLEQIHEVLSRDVPDTAHGANVLIEFEKTNKAPAMKASFQRRERGRVYASPDSPHKNLLICSYNKKIKSPYSLTHYLYERFVNRYRYESLLSNVFPNDRTLRFLLNRYIKRKISVQELSILAARIIFPNKKEEGENFLQTLLVDDKQINWLEMQEVKELQLNKDTKALLQKLQTGKANYEELANLIADLKYSKADGQKELFLKVFLNKATKKDLEEYQKKAFLEPSNLDFNNQVEIGVDSKDMRQEFEDVFFANLFHWLNNLIKGIKNDDNHPFRDLAYSELGYDKRKPYRSTASDPKGFTQREVKETFDEFEKSSNANLSHKPLYHDYSVIDHKHEVVKVCNDYFIEAGIFDKENPQIKVDRNVCRKLFDEKLGSTSKLWLMRFAMAVHDIGKLLPLPSGYNSSSGWVYDNSGQLEFTYPEHEKLSADMLRHEDGDFYKFFKKYHFKDRQIDYISDVASRHYELGLIRSYAMNQKSGFSFDFVNSPKFEKAIKTMLSKNKNKRYAYEIGLTYLWDQLGKIKIPPKEILPFEEVSSDKDMRLFESKIRQWLIESGIEDENIDTRYKMLQQTAVSIYMVRKYLEVLENSNSLKPSS